MVIEGEKNVLISGIKIDEREAGANNKWYYDWLSEMFEQMLRYQDVEWIQQGQAQKRCSYERILVASR